MRAVALRYALAPACVFLAVLVHLSPAGAAVPLAGLFVFAVLIVAWFGGAGPGFVAAVLAAMAVPHFDGARYPTLGGLLDIPRFITFSIEGLAVGWWSRRRRQVEVALRQSEARYERTIAATGAQFWDWDVVKDDFYVSPTLLDRIGFPPGTVFAGRADFMRRAPFHAEDVTKWESAVRSLFTGDGERLSMELRVAISGRVRWHELSGMCFRDAAGRVVRWSGSATDIHERKSAQEALLESEKRYELAMNASDEGVWDWIPAGDKLYLSPRFVQLFGLAPGTTFAGRAAMFRAVLMPPEDRAEVNRLVADHLASKGGRLDFEFRILVDDAVRWIHARGLATRDSSGALVRWNGAVSDVTERKRADVALRNSGQRYALAMEAAGDGHIDTDLISGKFYFSPRLLEIVGHPPDASFADRADWLRRFPFHPEDRPKWEAAMAAHLAGRESHFKMEQRIVVRGEVRWIALHFLSTRDAAGRPIRWTGSIGDITERKRIEDALRAGEERYSLAMEASDEGFIDSDIDTDRFVTSDRLNEIFGIPPGTRFADRHDFLKYFSFYGDDAKIYGDMIHAVSMPGGSDRYAFEFRIVLSSGEVRWLSTRGMVTRDSAGRARRRIGVVADITSRKVAEEALRTSEDRFGRAVAGSYDGVWDIDLVGRSVYLSARTRELCGLPPGPDVVPLDGWLAVVPVHPEDQQKRVAAMQAHLSGKAPMYEGEFRILQLDGVYRWRHFHGVCVRDADGKPLRVAGSLSDVDARRRAEDALRESEERYEQVVVAAGAGFWEWDLANEKYYVSPRLREMGGLAPDSVIASSEDFHARVPMHPEDGEKWLRSKQELFAGRDSRLSMVIRVLHPVGMRSYRADGMCFRNAEGAPIRWIGSMIDVTNLKMTEEALRESEERYELAMAASESGYWDWDVKSDRYFVSARANELAGNPQENVLTTRDKYGSRERMHPDDWAKWEAARKAMFAGTGERLAMECRYVVRGETRWHSMQALCKRDNTGQVTRWSGSQTDITERKLAEEGLRESEGRYGRVVSATEAGFWDWDVLQDKYYASPRFLEMYGLPPDTIIADRADFHARAKVHPEDVESWQRRVQALFESDGSRLSAEIRIVVGTDTRWLRLDAMCFRDATGRVVRWTGSAVDITPRKRAEDDLTTMELQLRQAQRLEALGTLAGGIAHDFNNILGAILGYGEMARRDVPKGSRLARDLNSIMIAGERGRALVDRVLAFSRSAVGERVPVHVERVVRETLDLVSANLPPSVTLHAKLRARRAAVLGDATQVHQVADNLATNAVQAMPSGGTLSVELAVERVEVPRVATIGGLAAGEYVVLTVTDTGAGIAPEIVDRIFDPFFTTKEVGTGTGLGLSLVHGIVTELGGCIDVITKAGAGTTFVVHLPSSGEMPEAKDDVELELPRGGGQRVLVVDDEEPLVLLATRTLEELGYAPVGFTSSGAALAAFRADPQRFDALITDERMPGMSGSALIGEVRSIRSAMPVVLMTGYQGTAVEDVDEVLQKPLSASDLATSLARVLQK